MASDAPLTKCLSGACGKSLTYQVSPLKVDPISQSTVIDISESYLVVDDCFDGIGSAWTFREGSAWFPPRMLSGKASEMLGDFRIDRKRNRRPASDVT
jgi:hypothetical protein